MTGGRRLRLLAAAVALLAAAACSSGGDQADDDPLAPASTVTSVGASGTAAPAPAGYGPPVLLGNAQDPAVDESSGLVASRRTPGVYWTHNDSGDDPILFCMRGRGESCGAWRVTGAEARDWEDIAVGPGPQADGSYLYVGDIGDNLQVLDEIVVYRLREPDVPTGSAGPTRASPGTTDAAETIRLRYPDGAHDAEALLVHPRSGDLYVVAKEANPTVYVARAPLTTSSANRLEAVATLAIGLRDVRTGLVTGGDISPDGRHVALCTYADAYELTLPDSATAFDAVWQETPQRLSVGARAQGESIAYRLDSNALLTTSERVVGLPVPLQQIERR